MVATRRGTRVGSPAKNISDETSQATVPVLSTRNRHRIVMEDNGSQSEITGDSQTDDKEDTSLLTSSPSKQETRRSMCHHADKKPESTHEADVSESESCCSVASVVLATPRTRRRTVVREKPQITAKDDVSEAESCSSAVSVTRSRRAPRSTKKRIQTTAASDAPKTDDGGLSCAESCSSVISLTQVLDTRRITRSRRKTVVAEPDPSEPESCSSSVSGIRGSTVRRSTRNQKVKPIEPIPLNLEETTDDTPSSPVSTRLRDRESKTSKSEVAEVVYDSEDCMSGPSLSPWRMKRHEEVDTLVGESGCESVPIDICTSQDSPSSLRGKETPCSSRTGSASSNRAVPVTRTRSKSSATSDLRVNLTPVDAMLKEDREGEECKPLALQPEVIVILDAEETMNMTMDSSEAQDCTIIEETAADITLVLDADRSIGSNLDVEVKMLETQSTNKIEDPVGSEIETQTQQEEELDKMADENREETGDVAMENHEDHAAENSVDADSEGPVSSVFQKNVTEEMGNPKCGGVVTEDASVDETSVLLNDAQSPSSSSNTQADSSMTEQKSKRLPCKEMISLLDSSDDEESPDEGLSADEEEKEGSAQEAVEGINDEEMRSPDEGHSSVEPHTLFVIDARPGIQPHEKYYVDAKQIVEKEEDEEDFIDEEDDDDDEDSKVLFLQKKKPLMQLSTSIDPGLKMKNLGGLYISFDASKPKSFPTGLKKDQKKVDELLKKSVIVPDLEKKDAIPPYKESQHAAKLKRKAEREKTTGDGWFNMKAPELTEELRNDLKALKMRSAIDPKHFYKKNDREGFPKYFQVGTVVDSPVDFYSSRIPKKQRKRTIVEELMADAEFRSNNKKRYQEIMTEKAAQSAGKKFQKHKFQKKKANK